MPEVDPDNDAIRRYVVYHYRYDSKRHERRNVAVAAFDNFREFQASFSQLSADLDRRRREDLTFDHRESLSGTTLEPGHRARAANGQLIDKMARHGVWDPELVARLELPTNVAIMSVDIAPLDDRTGIDAAMSRIHALRAYQLMWSGRPSS
jgi:hypothetical protein